MQQGIQAAQRAKSNFASTDEDRLRENNTKNYG
jgi:hypothetical protein